jgi:hypothetical protein
MSQIKRLKTPDKDVGLKKDNFNMDFVSADNLLAENIRAEAENKRRRQIIPEFKVYEPEKEVFRPKDLTDDLGINMKNLFFDVLEMLANKENPIPFIMSSPQRQFIFALMIIILGTLTLFLSNLMI